MKGQLSCPDCRGQGTVVNVCGIVQRCYRGDPQQIATGRLSTGLGRREYLMKRREVNQMGDRDQQQESETEKSKQEKESQNKEQKKEQEQPA